MNRQLNILVDSAMPFGAELFAEFGHLHQFFAGEIPQGALSSADVLLVRSTTQVDRALLAKAPKLKFVGTATAGFDHLDLNALQERSVQTSIASGCNAIAVAQYVVSALMHLCVEDVFDLTHKTIAIVGAGKTGTALSVFLDALGLSYILYDPPAQENGDSRRFSTFEQVLQADIISLHVPLVTEGKYPTLDMFAYKQLATLSPNTYLINACRGEVVNNNDLLHVFERGQYPNVVLDVWANEPSIDRRLIPYTRLATAHIAGHTLEGKARGTFMLYQALCKWTQQSPKLSLRQFLPDFTFNQPSDDGGAQNDQTFVHSCCLQIYDIAKDDRVFRSSMAQSDDENSMFANIRRSYQTRREYSAASISQRLLTNNKKSVETLTKLGFTITD